MIIDYIDRSKPFPLSSNGGYTTLLAKTLTLLAETLALRHFALHIASSRLLLDTVAVFIIVRAGQRRTLEYIGEMQSAQLRLHAVIKQILAKAWLLAITRLRHEDVR